MNPVPSRRLLKKVSAWRPGRLEPLLDPEARGCFELSRSLGRHLARAGFSVKYLSLFGLTDPALVLQDDCSYFTDGRDLKEEYLFSTIQHVCVVVSGLAVDPTAGQFARLQRGTDIRPVTAKLRGWANHRVCRSPETAVGFWRLFS